MRRVAPCGQCLPLFHPKTVLLIRDHKPKILIYDLFLDQCMSSDDNICFSGRNFFINPAFLPGSGGSGKKDRMAGGYSLLTHQICESFKMLICKNLRGNHKRSLITVFHSQDHSQKGKDGLSASNISLNKP